MEMQMRYAREELETRRLKTEEAEAEKKRPGLHIELPQILHKKGGSTTIVHERKLPEDTRPLTSSTTSSSRPTATTTTETQTEKEKEEHTAMITPKDDTPCCVMCHKDVSCIIL